MSLDVPEGELLRAQHLLEVGRWEEAARRAAALTVSTPEDPRAWVVLASALLDGDDRQGAERAARGAVAVAPGDVDALLVLSESVRETDALDALAAAHAAVVEAPDRWHPHAQSALCLSDLGRIGDARRAMGTAERLAPADPAVHVTAAAVHLAHRRPRDARRSARRALELAPGDGDAMRMLGLVELARTRTRRAAELVVAAGTIGSRPAALGRLVDVVVVRWAESALVWLGLTLALTAISGLALGASTGPVWGVALVPAAFVAWAAWTGWGLARALRGALGTMLRRKLVHGAAGRTVALCFGVAVVSVLLVWTGPWAGARTIGAGLALAVITLLLLLAVADVVRRQGKAARNVLAVFVVLVLARIMLELPPMEPVLDLF